jgi:hypothetical protein
MYCVSRRCDGAKSCLRLGQSFDARTRQYAPSIRALNFVVPILECYTLRAHRRIRFSNPCHSM